VKRADKNSDDQRALFVFHVATEHDCLSTSLVMSLTYKNSQLEDDYFVLGESCTKIGNCH